MEKEQPYKEFICGQCGDPCILRVFDTCNIPPSFCPYNPDKRRPIWTEKIRYQLKDFS